MAPFGTTGLGIVATRYAVVNSDATVTARLMIAIVSTPAGSATHSITAVRETLLSHVARILGTPSTVTSVGVGNSTNPGQRSFSAARSDVLGFTKTGCAERSNGDVRLMIQGI